MTSRKKPFKNAQPANPPKDLYVDSPPFLKHWHKTLIENRWLRGGILALILGVFAMGLVMMAFRVWEPPDLAKLLPKDTLHYQEGLMTGSWGALSPEPEPIPGTQGLRGLANISSETGLTAFYALKSRFNKYRSTIALDGARRFFRRYYVVAETPAAFDTLERAQQGAIPTLSKDPFFQAMRPALPYRASFFEFYRTGFWWTEKSEAIFSIFSFAEPARASLEHLAQNSFPLLGSVVKFTGAGKLTQTYVAGDKEFKKSEAGDPFFFHLEKKYKGKLLPYLPGTITALYGGEQLGATLEQLSDLLNVGSETRIGTALIGEKVDRFFLTYFGPTLDRRQILNPLFDNEYAVGFFPSESSPPAFLLALELTPDTVPLLDQLVQAFLGRGLVQIDREKASIKAEKLEPRRIEYNGELYDLYVRSSGQPFLAALIKDEVAILTTGKKEMEQVIDAMNGTGRYTDSEKYPMIEPLIDSVDHLHAAPADGGATDVRAMGVNLFDDGMMIFTHER